ncbi:hypothetical protein D3C78_938520 [compost metagenome]
MQARLAEVFTLNRALLLQFEQLFFQALAAQAQLFSASLASRQARIEFTLLPGFVLSPATHILTALFQFLLLFTLLLKLCVEQLKHRFLLLALKAQALQFLTTSQDATFGITGAIDP